MEWCIDGGVFGRVEVEGAGERGFMLRMRILGLPEPQADDAVEAISFAKEEDVVVTTGGRRWP